MSSIASNHSRSASIAASQAGWSRLPAEYAIPELAPSEAEAQEYCRRLARSHYENFSVASWFLPERLRQHFFNLYAYCRIADDLGDEVGDPEASLQLLDEWQAELDACYDGNPRHPVFVATGGDGAQVRYSSDSLLRIYCRHFVRTRLSPAMKPFRILLATATTRQIR